MAETKSISFPMRHISVRVPWHDQGWNGSICRNPKQNTACCKLLNIAASKNTEWESEHSGKSLRDLSQEQWPPCVKERGAFMADFPIEILREHPYARNNSDTHDHFRPTPLRHPAYAVAALPFRWLMRPVVFGDANEGERGLVNQYPLKDVDLRFEPELNFKTHWVQDKRNHQALLDCFWRHVRLEESLVFFYAKQAPLVEDTGRRILLGAGRVLKLGGLTEYAYNGPLDGKLRSLIWERMVTHSIRPDFRDGFLLPYREALERSEGGSAFDPAEVVAFAPEDRFQEFSFATEHVSDDAAISALIACRSALGRASDRFNHSIERQVKWIDQQLARLWKRRGAFPGTGAVLQATGIELGHFVAQALLDTVGKEGNPWDAWDAVLRDPASALAPELARQIDDTVAKSWLQMPTGRRRFLELLSRIDVSREQANLLASPEGRNEVGIDPTDAAYTENPYLIYETMRHSRTPVSVDSVDRGVFPTAFVRKNHPLPAPSAVNTPNDARRLRALTIQELEVAASNGDTLCRRADVITALRARADEAEGAYVTADLFAVAEAERFSGQIQLVEMASGERAYQLERLASVGETIRKTVLKRAAAQRIESTMDWRTELDSKLPALPEDPEEREREIQAREEKAAALAEISSARISVLIGPAGTGKTTLLSVLCQHPEIQEGNIVMLAPTGKARVRMEEVARQAGVANFSAKTLAQFLLPSKRFDPRSQRYVLTGAPGKKCGQTVIVDECSMLTEEMLAALIEALSGVRRLILVGDPWQLPPIGAGRPFADIVAELQPENIEAQFPRVGRNYAELTIPRRQGAGEREDLQLAAWFGGGALNPGDDRVFEILSGQRRSETVEFIRWEDPDELERCLPDALARNLNFDPSIEDWQAFAISLGGALSGQYVYFNSNRSGERAEAWQILTPVRQQPWGVDQINQFLHSRFKAKQLEVARQNVPPRQRRLPRPFGDAQIVYGDKVINFRNQSVRKRRIYPEPESDAYLANGEIGMVIGQIRTRNFNYEPRHLQVEFSTQAGSSFTFYEPKGDDSDFSLDLAYALTVHKAQGSEFGTVFLILPKSPLMLTRELIYTALTRQKDKVVILHQGSAIDIQNLSAEWHSSRATRLTNLFRAPTRVEIEGKFLEERLIHRTTRGDAVRSKSEVIIANLLHAAGVLYQYEQPLSLAGVVKYPDFTIEDDDAGLTYYWEHCGMMHDPEYKRRWEEKRAWYEANGIRDHAAGGGPAGSLIVTYDGEAGGIDAASINALVKRCFFQ